MREYRRVVSHIDYAPFGTFNYDFRGCVEARYEVTPPSGAFSMDDRLLDPLATDLPEGFQWPVASACSAEEGVTYTRTSARTEGRTERLGIPMHEAVIGTNVFRLALVFHDLNIPLAVRGGSRSSLP